MPAAKAPVAVSQGWAGQWGLQAVGGKSGPHPKSTQRCQEVLDKEREGRAGPASSSPGLLEPGKAAHDPSGNFQQDFAFDLQ